MARHGRAALAAKQEQGSDKQEMPGGAAGMPGEPPSQLAPQVNTTEEAQARAHHKTLMPEKWMVTDGMRAEGYGNRIRYNAPEGYLVLLQPGKIVTTATHNLAHMRSQGVVLARVPDEVVEEDEVPTAVVDADATSEGEAQATA